MAGVATLSVFDTTQYLILAMSTKSMPNWMADWGKLDCIDRLMGYERRTSAVARHCLAAESQSAVRPEPWGKAALACEQSAALLHATVGKAPLVLPNDFM